MQLKVFLLITFLLNVACLNINKYPSSLVESFADVEHMRMNESVEFLKKDPSSFVELFAGANPDLINQVIGMLDTLISEAVSSLKTLEDRKTETLNNFNTANSDLVKANNNQETANSNKEAAQEALQVAITAKSNADNVKVVAEKNQQSAQVQKEAAIKAYDDESPAFINEQKVLQEVIQKLRSLTDGYSKSDCRRPYSNNVRSVGDYGSYNGSGKTLDECQDLCAQTPDCKSFVVDQMGGMKCHLKSECPLRSEACIDGSSWKFINYYENSCE